MIEKAFKNGYAIGAFNAENMEMAEAIVEAAQEMNAPSLSKQLRVRSIRHPRNVLPYG